MTTTTHTFIRCGNTIYVGDANGNWNELHNFHTEDRAKRWQRDQEKKRPGSTEVRSVPPQALKAHKSKADLQALITQRKLELAKLTRQQVAEMRRDYHVKGQGTPAFHQRLRTAPRAEILSPHPYVAPDRDGSSFLRERSAKRTRSRNARNTRATFGDS